MFTRPGRIWWSLQPVMARSSLTLGLLGVFTAGLTSLAGVILGIVAIIRIDRSGGRLRGHRRAVAGVIVSVVVTVMAGAVFLPGFFDVGPTLRRNIWTVICASEISSAMRSYAGEHGGALPPADDWTEALQAHHGNLDPFLAARRGTGYGRTSHALRGRRFAMNTHLDGVRVGDLNKPFRTVLLFEVEPGSPLAGGPELLPPAPTYEEGYVVLFADGEVKNVPRGRIQLLRWKP